MSARVGVEDAALAGVNVGACATDVEVGTDPHAVSSKRHVQSTILLPKRNENTLILPCFTIPCLGRYKDPGNKPVELNKVPCAILKVSMKILVCCEQAVILNLPRIIP